MFKADKFVNSLSAEINIKSCVACNLIRPKYTQAPTPDQPPKILILHGNLEYHCPQSSQNISG